MKCLIERFQKFARLPRGERATLLRAWGAFALLEIALRLVPLPRLLALSERLSVKRRPDSGAIWVPPVPRLAWLVEVAGRYAPWESTCLTEALVLRWVLGGKGIATTLHIGVSRREATIEAHAWLEWEGQVITGGDEGGRFAPLASMR